MIWLILVAFCISQIHSMSKCSSCRAAPRGSESSKVLDMDFLMDFHYPKAIEHHQETALRAYPLSDHFERWVTSFLPNRSAAHPNILDYQRTNISSRKIEVPHAKDQSPFGKFIRTHAEEMKRDFLTMINFRDDRHSDSKSALTNRHRSHPHPQQPLKRERHPLAKRFFVSRKLNHFPKARKLKVDPFENFSWTPWRSRGHIVNVTKRDTGNRRMKLSDILTRAGLKKDKEEAIKVVLPLLLSDLKEMPNKNTYTYPLSAVNVETKEQDHSPVISSLNGKQSRQMRNFRVKGDDGKEFSFSVSAADVQQLMNILAKPNSSVVLERVSLDKNRSLLKAQVDKAKAPDRKKIPSYQKPNLVNKENVINTEALQLKEFETSVYEKILQMDIPSKQTKCPTGSQDSTKNIGFESITTTAKTDDTTGS